MPKQLGPVTLEVERTFQHPFNQYTPIKIRISKTYLEDSHETVEENATLRRVSIEAINDELELAGKEIVEHIKWLRDNPNSPLNKL